MPLLDVKRSYLYLTVVGADPNTNVTPPPPTRRQNKRAGRVRGGWERAYHTYLLLPVHGGGGGGSGVHATSLGTIANKAEEVVNT